MNNAESEGSLSKRKEKVDDHVPRNRARREIQSTIRNTKLKRHANRDGDQLSHVDYVVSSAKTNLMNSPFFATARPHFQAPVAIPIEVATLCRLFLGRRPLTLSC